MPKRKQPMLKKKETIKTLDQSIDLVDRSIIDLHNIFSLILIDFVFLITFFGQNTQSIYRR